MSSSHHDDKRDSVRRRERNISESKMNELRAAFRMLDINEDGRVQPDELAQMLGRMGVPVPEPELRRLLRKAHPSGEVGEEEFLCWMSALQREIEAGEAEEDDVTQDLIAAFRVFDRDADGFITREELRGALELMGEATSDATLDALLPPSGKISQDDFIKILL